MSPARTPGRPARSADSGGERRARKILFDTYWSPRGWKPEGERSISLEDLAFAKAAGVMFDPVTVTHDEVVARARAAVGRVTAREVADAFVASLASRRLELRSALGSYAVMRHLPAHDAAGTEGWCPVCGWFRGRPRPEDLNVLSFERLKWGGVRHDEVLYAALDLEWFKRLDHPTVTAEDVERLGRIRSAIGSSPAGTTATSLEARLVDVLPSNRAERNVVVAILGFTGVLENSSYRGYRERFAPYEHRDLPGRRFDDVPYPACWWRREDGLNASAFDAWFGHLR